MTQEQIDAMQQAQQGMDPAQFEGQPQYAQQPPAQPTQPPVQPEAPAQMPPEAIEEAKKVLGVDQLNEKLNQIEAQRQEAHKKAILAEMKQKYKDVPEEAVKEEMDKIKDADPVLYDTMMSSEKGLEMLFSKLQSNIEPKEEPDDITDTSNQPSPSDDAMDRIKEGKSRGDNFFMDLGTILTS